ncbi:hypothetical protein ACK6HG_004502 [Escherichia coli]
MNFKPNEEDSQHSQIIGQHYDDMAEANEAEDSKIMELEGLTDDD